MEILHVYDAAGQELRTEDLATHDKTVLVGLSDGGLVLGEAVAPGTEIVAALVRNEDGWALASSNPSVPVTAGPKAEPDMQLLPGLVCAIAGHSFRLERDEVNAGSMLLWRYDGSRVVADGVVAGRNLVAINQADGRPSVNPPLSGDTLFEFFPSANGIDVVTGTGEHRERQPVSAGTLFSVGGFEAMYLTAEDAAAAMKTSNPFGWPSRKPRRGLFLGFLLLVVLLTGAGILRMRQHQLEQRLLEPRGAVPSDVKYDHEPYQDTDDRITGYEVRFFQSLPEVLGAEPSPVAADLIEIGQLPVFTNQPVIARRVRFLKNVTEVQQLIRAGRWEELKPVMAGVDREMFTLADGDDFYSDAKEALEFVEVVFPAFLKDLVNDKIDPKTAREKWKIRVDGLVKDNLFVTGQTLQREIRRGDEIVTTVLAFVIARDAARMSLTNLPATRILQLTDAYANVIDLLSHGSFQSVADCCRNQALEIVEKSAALLLAKKGDPASAVELSRLNTLADLGVLLRLPADRLESWREVAKSARQMLSVRYQKLYQKFRLKGGSDPALARRIVDEMIEVGFVESPFYGWAKRERERMNKELEAKK